MQKRPEYAKACPEALNAMLALSQAVEKSALSSQLVELVYYRVSQLNGCAFCLDVHSKDLRARGETEQRLYMVSAWREAHQQTIERPGPLAMRKMLVGSFVSLDGVVESPMTWASRFFDEECKEYALRKLDDVEFFLFGRVAYETFVSVWPTITGDAYIDRINGLKKRGVDDARRGRLERLASQRRYGEGTC